MSFQQHVTEDLRLRVLLALLADIDHSRDEIALRNDLVQYQHRVGRDKLRTELSWLDEMGLVVRQRVGDEATGVWLLTLSTRGEDCATGLSSVPGVARPRHGG